MTDSLDTSSTISSRDARKLSQFLEYYGYKSGGSLESLCDALKKYQEFWGLHPDGVLGPNTQGHVAAPRSANPDIDDDTDPVLLSKLAKGKRQFIFTVTNPDQDLIDINEPDLGYDKGVKVLIQALNAWALPLGEKLGDKITFEFVDTKHLKPGELDLEITWTNFDGPGGTLACASSKEGLVNCSIRLDQAERWSLLPNLKYSLQPVVTHELGHLFGLTHTNNEKSVMYPFFREDFLTPSGDDIIEVITKMKKTPSV